MSTTANETGRWTVRVTFYGGRKAESWTYEGVTRSEAGDRARDNLWKGKRPIGTVQQILPA